MRKRRYEFNFWPGVADTMLVAFIIVLGLWFGHQSLTKLEEVTGTGGIRITGEQSEEYDRLRKRIPEMERELVSLRNSNNQLRKDLLQKDADLARALSRIRELEDALSTANGKISALTAQNGVLAAELAQAKKVNDKPPIISLPETSGYKFDSGTARLSADFADLLEKTVFADITKVLARGDVNTIEIIGHTDGQSVRSREYGNLDSQLGNVLSKSQSVSALRASSNADLGLIRAVAVRHEIEAWLKTQNLEGKIAIRCYSAANSVPLIARSATASSFSGEEAARRRIEIRFTQLERASQ